MPVDAAAPRATAPRGWRYAPVAVLLHWLLAALIVSMVALGWYMVSIEDANEALADTLHHLHESVGVAVFVLVLARLSWRLVHRPGALPASVARWEVVASLLVQRLLYTGMILLPVTGLLGASYTRDGLVLFGQRVPAWHAPGHDTAEAWFDVHEKIVWIMVGLVALHALAGLKHAFVDRDGVFQRMWF
jgi:cytochrome b561